MRTPHGGEALGRGFDHRVEVGPPPGTLLLKVGSDGRQVVFGQDLA